MCDDFPFVFLLFYGYNCIDWLCAYGMVYDQPGEIGKEEEKYNGRKSD